MAYDKGKMLKHSAKDTILPCLRHTMKSACGRGPCIAVDLVLKARSKKSADRANGSGDNIVSSRPHSSIG